MRCVLWLPDTVATTALALHPVAVIYKCMQFDICTYIIYYMLPFELT